MDLLAPQLSRYLDSTAAGPVGTPAEEAVRAEMEARGAERGFPIVGPQVGRLLELPASYYDDRASGNLISRLTYDAAQVTTAATSVLTVIFKDSLAMIGLIAWMLWLNWKLTLLALVMAPIIVGVVRKISGRLRASSRDVQRGMGEVTQVLQETIEGHKVVKLFGGQQAQVGSILVRQCGTRSRAGRGVGQGRDYTLFARVDGVVSFDQGGRRVNVVADAN